MDKILKPCPFCGENPQITSEKRLLSLEWNKNYPNDGKDLYINKIMYSVECTCCKLTKFFHTEDEATENWNRRPDMWIPVTERLPDEGDTVLMWHKEGFVMLAVNMFDEMDDVTHWMPLPEPPEGGKS